jgi:hypothetical protein
MPTWYIANYDVAVPVGDTPASRPYGVEKRMLIKGASISDDDLAPEWMGYVNDDALTEVSSDDAAASDATAQALLAEQRRGGLGDNEGVVRWNGWRWWGPPGGGDW